MTIIPQDCDPETRKFAQKVLQGIIRRTDLDLESQDWKFIARTSVVSTRVYIGASNEELDLQYMIQIDKV